jgi:hypothetical protein
MTGMGRGGIIQNFNEEHLGGGGISIWKSRKEM